MVPDVKGLRLAVLVVAVAGMLLPHARAGAESISISRHSGYPGARITVKGKNYTPKTHLAVYVGDPINVTTNKQGRFSVTTLIPGDARGNITISADLSSAVFTVTDPPATPAWPPTPGVTWDYPIGANKLDFDNDAQVFGLDWEETDPDTVDLLHARNARVVCYVSAGSYENWRSDADKYKDPDTGVTLGNPLDGWPGERWVDVTDPDLKPILQARMQTCKDKGFDAIDYDNVEAFNNHPGLPQDTAAAQITFNTWLADTTHNTFNLKVALKNDLDQVNDLVSKFDFEINEQCQQYNECDILDPFITAHKAVFEVEYKGTIDEICHRAHDGFSVIKKKLKLDAYRQACQ